MPNNARYAVGYCDNDKRYPDLFVKRSHVNKLVFHKWPQDPNLAEIWRKQVVKSRSNDFNRTPDAKGTFVCSNHFPLGGRPPNKPDTDYPSVFMTVSGYLHGSTPKKRKANRLEEQRSTTTKRSLLSCADEPINTEESDVDLPEESESVVVPLQIGQFTREFEVKFYTGLPSIESFKCLFDFQLEKAQRMQYWRGTKQTQKETRPPPTAFSDVCRDWC